MPRNKNTLKRAAIIQGIISENYERENLSKCKAQIFRNIIHKQYPMSERTFRRYLSIDTNQTDNNPKDDKTIS